MMKKAVYFLLLCFFLVGCSTSATNIYSTYSGLSSQNTYEKILVDAESMYLYDKNNSVPWKSFFISFSKELEERISHLLSAKNQQAIPLSSLLSPESEDKENEIASLLNIHRPDAILFVHHGKSDTAVSTIPEQWKSELSTGSPILGKLGSSEVVGVTRRGQLIYQNHYLEPAKTVTNHYTHCGFILYDTKANKIVWRAGTNTQGDVFKNSGRVIRSVSAKVVSQMEKDNLVP